MRQLTADDICKGTPSTGRYWKDDVDSKGVTHRNVHFSKACALRWATHFFDATTFLAVRRALMVEVQKFGHLGVAHWNDSPATTKEEIANLLNSVFSRFKDST